MKEVQIKKKRSWILLYVLAFFFVIIGLGMEIWPFLFFALLLLSIRLIWWWRNLPIPISGKKRYDSTNTYIGIIIYLSTFLFGYLIDYIIIGLIDASQYGALIIFVVPGILLVAGQVYAVKMIKNETNFFENASIIQEKVFLLLATVSFVFFLAVSLQTIFAFKKAAGTLETGWSTYIILMSLSVICSSIYSQYKKTSPKS